MVKLALFVRLGGQALGKEAASRRLPRRRAAAGQCRGRHDGLVCASPRSPTFGVFDAFADETGRNAHLQGQDRGGADGQRRRASSARRRRSRRSTCSPPSRSGQRSRRGSGRSRAGVSGSAAKRGERRGEAFADRRGGRVDAVADHPAAGDHHVAPRRRRAGEDQRIERSLAARHAEQRIGVADRPPAHRRARPATRPQRRLAGRRRRRRRACGANSRSALDAPPESRARRRRCAARRARRWPYSSQRSSSRQSRVTWLSEPIVIGTPASSQPGRSAQAVAEVGLGARGRARRRRRFAATAAISGALRMRRVDELPARVEPALASQPLDRPRAGGGEAVVDLAGLLGDVDVDRPGEAVGERCAARRDRVRARARAASGSPGRRRAAAGRGARSRCAAADTSPPAKRGSAAGRRAARRLRRSRRARRAPAASSGRCRRRRRRRPAPTTSPAGRHARCRRGRVLQVVELAHLRVAAAQQLDVELGRRRRAAARARCAARRAYMRSRHDQKSSARRVAPLGAGRRRRAGRRGCARRPRRAAAGRQGRARASGAARDVGPSPRPSGRRRRRAAATLLAPAAGAARRAAPRARVRVASAAIGPPVERRLQAARAARGCSGASDPVRRRDRQRGARLVHVARQPISSWIACTPSCGPAVAARDVAALEAAVGDVR